MLILKFGPCRLKASQVHEFGDRQAPKLLKIELGLVTVYKVSQSSRWIDFNRAFVGDKQGRLEWIKSVRLARQKAYKKGHAEGRKVYQQMVDYWKGCYESEVMKSSNVEKENNTLRHTIAGLATLKEPLPTGKEKE